MPGPRKIATCCYCGTRAALVLTGDVRHELSCAACGAPLHNLKRLPDREPPAKPKARRARPVAEIADAPRLKKKPGRKRKKRNGVLRRFLHEAWDVIEDIID